MIFCNDKSFNEALTNEGKVSYNEYNYVNITDMKNVIKLLVVMLLLITEIEAQESQAPFKTLQSFNNDTLAYLEYNYTTRSNQYINKTIGNVLQELELPIISVIEWSRIDHMHSSEKGGVASVSLGIVQMGNKCNPLKDYYITIVFMNLITDEEFIKLRNQQNIYKWTPELYNYIKDMEIRSIYSNPYITSKRDKLPQSNNKPKERKSIDDAIKTITSEQLKNAELIQVPSTVPPLKKTP